MLNKRKRRKKRIDNNRRQKAEKAKSVIMAEMEIRI
jgi:hypothetical protein